MGASGIPLMDQYLILMWFWPSILNLRSIDSTGLIVVESSIKEMLPKLPFLVKSMLELSPLDPVLLRISSSSLLSSGEANMML